MGLKPETGVILLTGGLDSATVAAIAKDEGYELSAPTCLYGQRHKIEIDSAKKIAAYFGIDEHKIIEIALDDIALSSLTGEGDIPKGRSAEEMVSEIPTTYVPARNLIFLSYGVSYAESIDARVVFTGVNAIDFSGYPDCRPEFIKAFQRAVDEGTKTGVSGERGIKIKTPLLFMKKKEIIEKGLSLNVDYSLTHSCYSPKGDGTPCGDCDSCILRERAFEKIGISDPVYERIMKEKKLK